MSVIRDPMTSVVFSSLTARYPSAYRLRLGWPGPFARTYCWVEVIDDRLIHVSYEPTTMSCTSPKRTLPDDPSNRIAPSSLGPVAPATSRVTVPLAVPDGPPIASMTAPVASPIRYQAAGASCVTAVT